MYLKNGRRVSCFIHWNTHGKHGELNISISIDTDRHINTQLAPSTVNISLAISVADLPPALQGVSCDVSHYMSHDASRTPPSAQVFMHKARVCRCPAVMIPALMRWVGNGEHGGPPPPLVTLGGKKEAEQAPRIWGRPAPPIEKIGVCV